MPNVIQRLRRTFYSTLWVVGIGVGAGLGSGTIGQVEAAPADTAPQIAQRELIEEACRDALERNTIEALEEFLRKYPESDTACQTLALDALNRFADTVNDGDSGGDGGEGYGGG
jgi:hypothetical protein